MFLISACSCRGGERGMSRKGPLRESTVSSWVIEARATAAIQRPKVVMEFGFRRFQMCMWTCWEILVNYRTVPICFLNTDSWCNCACLIFMLFQWSCRHGAINYWWKKLHVFLSLIFILPGNHITEVKLVGSGVSFWLYNVSTVMFVLKHDVEVIFSY